MKIHIFLFFFLANFLLLTSAQKSQPAKFVRCLYTKFNNSSQDVIFTPRKNATSYEEFYESLFGNLRFPFTSQLPVAIITPDRESQVQAIISCATKYDVQIKIRAGGHDYESLSYVSRNSFAILDMRNLSSISIDAQKKTAWVQTGATLGEFYYTISQTSRTLGFTAGICSTVGVGGHMSGGGYGMMARKNGLAVDNVIDARIVNAKGQILNRRSMGEDLYWAIRGGGGASFGVVLAYRVNLIPVPEIVTVFNISRVEQKVVELVYKYQEVADKLDERILLTVFLRSMNASNVNHTRVIQSSYLAHFLGRAVELLPIMQEKFPELGLVEADLVEMSWIETALFFWRFPQDAPLTVLLDRVQRNVFYFKGKSDYLTDTIVSKEGIQGMLNYLHLEDELRTEIQFSPYGGALDRVASSATPFPHRAGTRHIIHYGVWTPTNETRHVTWMRNLYAYMRPYVSKNPRAAYLNYRDLDVGRNNRDGNTSYAQASVWGLKYYGDNFKRLVRVKTVVDPTNFFRNEQSIPPAYASIENEVDFSDENLLQVA